eukprot:CAMPEP_0113468816 /NCGR_PEP_ID=MMETSP0014_2-20120614/15561_1 /TAXON_ID=2857 /ORGANISM="Nitzschia sp." /LENGTH=581 /DNA_ID=CAMNT_0000361239 /DNA_START=138 /DNA_END=1883 /DNA_ORIENTATION=- /assembly_acc=CAM_ASM_000159
MDGQKGPGENAGAPGDDDEAEPRHGHTNVWSTAALAPPIDNSAAQSSGSGAAYSGQLPQDQPAAVRQSQVQPQHTQYSDVNALLLQQLLRQVQTSTASAAPQQHPIIAFPFGTAGMPGLANPAQLQPQVTANALSNPLFAPPPAAADAMAPTAASNTAIAVSSQTPQELLSAVQQLILQNQIAGMNAPQLQPPPATTESVTHLPLMAETTTNPLQMNRAVSNNSAAIGGTISSTGASAAVPAAFGSSAANLSTQQQQSNILGGLFQAFLQGQVQQQQQQAPTVAGSTSTGSGIQIPPSVPPELLQQLQLLVHPAVATGNNHSAGSVATQQQQQLPPPFHDTALSTLSSSTAGIGQNVGYNLTQPHVQQQSQLISASSSSLLGSSRSPAASDADSRITGRQPVSLYLDFDSTSLNQFQCLLRQQIEVFETPLHQARSSQGRNTPIVAGQVGIRCKWCFNGIQKGRPVKGCIYYSKKMDGIYQVAQNLAKTHFLASGPTSCPSIPREIKNRLIAIHSTTKRGGAGKSYWTDGLRALGVYEDNNILRFRPLANTIQRQPQASEHPPRSLPSTSTDSAAKDDEST